MDALQQQFAELQRVLIEQQRTQRAQEERHSTEMAALMRQVADSQASLTQALGASLDAALMVLYRSAAGMQKDRNGVQREDDEVYIEVNKPAATAKVRIARPSYLWRLVNHAPYSLRTLSSRSGRRSSAASARAG